MRTITQIDEDVVQQFAGQVVVDVGATASTLLAHVGDRLGLYKAMADGEPVTPAELARRTATHERMVLEWLRNQVIGGYVVYDPQAQTFRLPPEHALVLAVDDSPVSFTGTFASLAGLYRDLDKVLGAFTTGKGFGWGDHDPAMYRGVEEFLGPKYAAHLTPEWIPALDGVTELLTQGARVADVGCGHGVSTVLMAQAYPASTFLGVDPHAPSIDRCRELATDAGVNERATFLVARAEDLPDERFDLVCMIDCLHDMGDPLAAARRARQVMTDDATLLLVEPTAADRLEDNCTPVARFYSAASTMLCTPASLAEDGIALGGQAGAARLGDIMCDAGFTRFREAATDPFNTVYEVRP